MSSIEAKCDKILDKLEQTRIDIQILYTVVKDSQKDISKNQEEIEHLQEEINKIKLEVQDLKFVSKILKWALGIAISASGAIILNIFKLIFP